MPSTGPVVVEPDPVVGHVARVLRAFMPVAVDALLLQCADDSLDLALLRAMRRSEFLLRAAAAHRPAMTWPGTR